MEKSLSPQTQHALHYSASNNNQTHGREGKYWKAEELVIIVIPHGLA
jgi:hypothetical protein